MDTCSNLSNIPTVDTSVLNGEASDERRQLLRHLVTSLASYGAIRITGHGVSECKIRRTFDAVREFFSLPKQLKKSAICSSSESSLTRGYGVHCGYECFAAGPSYDKNCPTPWPIGVRGDTFRMIMQAFFIECASLHHDLLQVIEEALELGEDELVSRWIHHNGDIHSTHHVSMVHRHLQTSAAGSMDGKHIQPMLKLVFQGTKGEEIIIVCEARIRKWIQNQLLSLSGARAQLQEQETICNMFPANYSLEFVGYEDIHSISENKI